MTKRVPQKHVVVSPNAYNVIKEDSRRNYRSMKATVEMIVATFYGQGETVADQRKPNFTGGHAPASENEE